MSNNNTVTLTDAAGTVFDPTIHRFIADGVTPDTKDDGTFKLKPGRKPGSTVTVTRGKFDVNAVSAAYLARAMASGDLDAIMAFNGMSKGQRVEFLTSTPEYAETVTAKVVADAAAKISAILDAAGPDLYHEIMELVRFGA